MTSTLRAPKLHPPPPAAEIYNCLLPPLTPEPAPIMVLEEATATPDTFTSDSAPSSDSDPYSGDRSPTHLATRDPSYIAVNSGRDTLYVNASTLPKEAGFFSSRAHSLAFADAVAKSCGQAQKVLGRPVTQEEADALAYHFAKSVRVSSYGGPVGSAVALVFAVRGYSKYRFPFYTPGKNFNPDKFFLLKGPAARAMWQIFRANVYFGVGTFFGSLFFGSYALTVGTAGRAMDPRLKSLMDALQQQTKSTGLPGNRQIDQTAAKREGETFDMARQRQNVQETWRNNKARQAEATAAKPASDNDMSPTGGAFGAEFLDLGSTAVSDTAMMSDEQARRQSEGIQRQQEASYAKSLEPHQAASQRRHEPSRDAFSSEDDSKPAQSGSAWERLRQQAASGKPSAPASRVPPSRETSSPTSEGFTFASGGGGGGDGGGEERSLGKAEAQKDFDSRLERERSGQDFEDKKRW